MTSTDPDPPGAAKKQKPAGTEYVLLKCVDAAGVGEVWEAGARVRARSVREAIRSAALTGEGRYVAIPERSFQPVRVKVETVQRIKLEDA